jgi:xylulokinase
VSLHLGIDLGTSGIKVALVEDGERVLASAARPVAVSIPHLGWSEQDPDAWVAAVWDCLDELAAAEPGRMGAVEGIGLSGQMLAALLLDAGHRPVRPAILWNDQRAIAECADLLARVPDIGARTNGTPDPGITAPKLLWLARHEPAAFSRARMLLLTKDYVRLALTGEIASEPTDAGGTQLLDVATGAWDPALCAAAGWDPAHLPPLVRSWEAAGGLRAELAARWGLRPGLPVAAGCGDNMGSTLGAGAARPGDAVLTVGTSGVACLVDGAFHPGPEAAILTSAHAAPDAFLSMGVVMSATAALDWTARLGGVSAADLVASAEAFAATGRIEEAPVFLPCLNGVRTPANRPGATGRIEGLHPGVTHASLGYAVLEGVAFQFALCVEAQRSAGVEPTRFVLVGGGARSGLWGRLLATALGEVLERPDQAEAAGPCGAARLAAVAAGAPMDLLRRRRAVLSQIAPEPALAERLAPRRARLEALMRGL